MSKRSSGVKLPSSMPGTFSPPWRLRWVVHGDEAVQVLLQLAPRTEGFESDPADEAAAFVDGAAFEAGAVAEGLVGRLQPVVPALHKRVVQWASCA
jgi:hypothetical protein